jgi:hypothetical protein
MEKYLKYKIKYSNLKNKLNHSGGAYDRKHNEQQEILPNNKVLTPKLLRWLYTYFNKYCGTIKADTAEYVYAMLREAIKISFVRPVTVLDIIQPITTVRQRKAMRCVLKAILQKEERGEWWDEPNKDIFMRAFIEELIERGERIPVELGRKNVLEQDPELELEPELEPEPEPEPPILLDHEPELPILLERKEGQSLKSFYEQELIDCRETNRRLNNELQLIREHAARLEQCDNEFELYKKINKQEKDTLMKLIVDINIKCPLSDQPIIEPCITSCGHIFEEKEINDWITMSRSNVCPVCQQQMNLIVIPNKLQLRQIYENIVKLRQNAGVQIDE